MYTLASSVVRIDRPASKVFAYVANLENFGDWFPGVIGMAAQDELPFATVGKCYAETVAVPLRRHRRVTLRVVDVDVPRRLVTQGDLPLVLPRMEIDLRDAATRACDVQWRMVSRNPSPLARRTVLPLAGLLMGRRADIGLRNLKRLLEAHTAQS